jgi:hypothetical protein
MISKVHPDNQKYLDEAAGEYKELIKKLERGKPGSIIDVALEHI